MKQIFSNAIILTLYLLITFQTDTRAIEQQHNGLIPSQADECSRN